MNNTWLKIRRICLYIIFCIPLILYISKFGGSKLSDDPQDWGVFGDYFGGVYSILVTLIAVYLARALEKRDSKIDRIRNAIVEINDQISTIKNNNYNLNSINRLLHLITRYKIYFPDSLCKKLSKLYDVYLKRNAGENMIDVVENDVLQELKQLYNA